MLKRLLSALFLLSLFSSTLFPLRSMAAVPIVIDQPIIPGQPSIIITEFGGGLPDFFELYNQSTQPVSLDGWRINVVVQEVDGATLQPIEQSYSLEAPSGWLLPKQYHTLQRGNGITANASYYQWGAIASDSKLLKISVIDTAGIEQYAITPPLGFTAVQWAQHKQRTNASLKMSGVFATDYAAKTTAPTVFSDPLYLPPDSAPVQIMEILANSRSCSPLETALDCNDYIKLYNPTVSPIDLSVYRLRTDSGGLKSSATNTFSLPYSLAPGAYITVSARDTGEPISITNTGGYVWLEDAEGVHTYQTTMVAYPDASATTDKGMSWAFDNTSSTWKWMTPAPNTFNYWPPAAGRGAEEAAALADCGPGKERNPETNRCRSVVATTTSTLTPCRADQERNPETNRCRSVLGASTSMQACDAGQYRNPETNRCKKLESATGLMPCNEGYERNPNTNRCRKISLASKDIASVKDTESKTKANTTGWLLVGAAVMAATTYGIYEWRQDILVRIRSMRRS